MHRLSNTTSFSPSNVQIYYIPIVFEHQIKHTTKVSVRDLLLLLDQRDEELKAIRSLKRSVERTHYPKLISNELRITEKVRYNIERFQINSYIAERPHEGWEENFNKARMYGEIINSMLHILDPPLDVPPKMDASGEALDCLECNISLGVRIIDRNPRFEFDPEATDDLENKLLEIEERAYQLSRTWAEPESQPDPAPYYPIEQQF